MTTLFIADLHLCDERPAVTGLFVDFLRSRTSGASALYILGDLFEYWAGDDTAQADQQTVIRGLQDATSRGLPIYFMHGNRDFLIGQRFATETGCRLLTEPTIIEINGERVLLMHGDLLCTDDHGYLKFRAMVRNPDWQREFLLRPAPERVAIAREYRAESKKQSRRKAPEIMDVNQQEVARVMEAHDVRRLIHGHTHRPAMHSFAIDGDKHHRIVLGDWYLTGSVLVAHRAGYRLEDFPA